MMENSDKMSSTGEGNGKAFQYSCLENPMTSMNRQKHRTSLGWEDPLEEGLAIHASIPAWKISWIEASGSLQSIGSQRVRHD